MPNNHFVAPPALRQWDYDNQGHLITRECDCVIRYRKEDLDFIDQSLFLVNKQIYAETRSFLLAHNTLSLMPMDLHAMAPARWETILQLTHYDIGMDIDAMPQMVDFICSTVYELHDLRLVFVIPGFERTRCQYWVDKVKGLMEPLRDIHVRGQVEIRWIERHLVNNPEVRKETVKWFEKLGRDMMGGPGNGQPIVTGEKKKKEVTVALAGSAAVGVASAGSALVGSASAGTVLAGSASVGSASISATSVSSNSGSVSGGGSDGSSSG
jgi:hypothetical protein